MTYLKPRVTTSLCPIMIVGNELEVRSQAGDGLQRMGRGEGTGEQALKDKTQVSLEEENVKSHLVCLMYCLLIAIFHGSRLFLE
jgi:hypothetical protein